MRRAFYVIFILGWSVMRLVLASNKSNFEISFLDVGQGDAIFIRAEKRVFMVDTGPNNFVSYYVFHEFGHTFCYFDIIFITHNHLDHYGGLEKLEKICQIDRARFNDVYEPQEPEPVNKQEIQKKFEENNFLILQIFPKNFNSQEKHSDENYNSKIFLVKYKKFEALLLADAPVELLEQVNWKAVDDGYIEDGLDVIKASHHGAVNGLYKPLYRHFKPKICIISVGKNSYGHPAPESIGYMELVGCKIYRTDMHGSIEVKLD